MLAFTLITFLTLNNMVQPIEADGIDLNPALLGCIMSGGMSCLENTGINFIDNLFAGGNAPQYTKQMMCTDLRHKWCGDNYGGWDSGYWKCRQAKISYYVKKKQEKNEWHENFSPSDRYYANDHKEKYFRDLEKKLTKPNQDNYFDCNSKQREIYIKAYCGNMQESSINPKYIDPKTMTCNYPY